MPQALQKVLERELPGFGERFRAALAHDGEGALAALTDRSTAGISAGCAVFVLPHSDAGVDLGISKMIIPVLPQLVAAMRAEG